MEEKIFDTEALDISVWLLAERKRKTTIVDEVRDFNFYKHAFDIKEFFIHMLNDHMRDSK